WTAVLTAPDGKAAPGELLAALYDQSLDAYLPLQWPHGFSNLFHTDSSERQDQFDNQRIILGNSYLAQWKERPPRAERTYRRFPEFVYDPSPRPMVAYEAVAPMSVAQARAKPLTMGVRSGQLGISANAIDALLFGNAGSTLTNVPAKA